MLRAIGLLALTLAFSACGKTPAATTAATATTEPAAIEPAAPVATTAGQASTPAPDTPPPPLANPLAAGSQGARDDLYCSSIIFDRYSATGDALSPTEEAVRMKNEAMGMTIAQAGADKLMAEGAARVTQLGAISDAYADQAAKDLKAGKPRLTLEACMKRAMALPIPQ
jgi:hypothetical protein